MSRFALGVEYDGSIFYGFQTQVQTPTVQACLESAISQVADEPLVLAAAGRTDTGVHATGQVVHFDTIANRNLRSWLLGINSNLPEGISAIWIKPVDSEFHARFSAEARSYRYTIINRWIRPAIDARYCAWYKRDLDHVKMHQAAQALVGEHDFSAFRAKSCQSRHAIRRMHQLAVHRHHNHVYIDIEGNAFLHHMVRNVVGSLVLVGRDEQPVEWIKQLLEGKDRDLAGPTAAARGLCLQQVLYPKRFAIPSGPSKES